MRGLLRTTHPVALGLLFAAFSVRADEGMWTFDNPPTKLLTERYGFTPTQEWLDHIRLSSVRFNNGGSGSFVSRTGLVLTNHHVGLGCIQKISSEGKDFVASGYVARTAAEEVACPDLELNVLLSMENVTARVLSSVKPGAGDKDAADQRKAATARIEKACADATKLRCDVVKLYGGAEYQLYRYRKYTDVRLVFAPEQSIAFYGGDPDNFTFPRFDLDVAIFRAYEDGKPVSPQHFLKWSENGPKESELLLVSGHPGDTGRLQTLAQLQFSRDLSYPTRLKSLARRRALLEAYSKRSSESARRAKAALFGIENTLKALGGYQAGLLDPGVMKKKAADEAAFRDAAAKDADLTKMVGDPWAAVAEAMRKVGPRLFELRFVGFGGSRLLDIAGDIVWLVAEKEKPNDTRFEEYRESNLASLEFALFSSAPIYRDLEETTLADRWAEAGEALGTDHPFVKTVWSGKAPSEAAKGAVDGTRLDDPDVRKALVKGGRKAVEASTDSMIVLARKIDPLARALRKFDEDEIESVLTRTAEKLEPARFRLYGKSTPPDATFTLRLSFGTTRSYSAEGTVVPWKTSFYGLYGRSADFDDQDPFKLPARWIEKKAALDLATPLNFVLTADIIGGNSGSPVVNARGELVGLIFDGNIHSLVWRYVFSDEKGRAVAVHSKALTEAITKVFDDPALATELQGR